MDLHQKFKAIVMGTMVVSSATGCPMGNCTNVAEKGSEPILMTANEPAVDRAVAEDLAAFESENPKASANDKLEHLFARPGALWDQSAFNASLKGIVDQAVAEGGISERACEAICATTRLTRINECIAGDQEQHAIRCIGIRGSFCGGAGRRPAGLLAEQGTAGSAEGQWWAHIAYLEKAAVHAFIQVAHELRELGAPAELVERCVEAAIDEVVHARLVGELAAQHGVQPAAAVVEEPLKRSLFEFALQNATEGCVRETYAGLEATWQAENAAEATRDVLRRIAIDECGHAELSWEIHAWALKGLSAEESMSLKEAQLAELAELRRELQGRDSQEFPESLGLPAAEDSMLLLNQMSSELALLA